MQLSDGRFVSGLDLSESFYKEAVAPILHRHFPDLSYSAGLIGSGSEVLGFDTEMSSDHDWGPRAMLFVTDPALADYKSRVSEALGLALPRTFMGYPTGFSPEDQNNHGVQSLSYSQQGPINHRVEFNSLRQYIIDYLAFDVEQQLAPADWLSFPEQKLRAITAGRIFRDDSAALEKLRERFSYYPHDVWLYLLASCWMRIGQEEHLMGRAGIVGDTIGSSLIGSRLVRDLMRLCFLMEKRYAPYAKWFGTAFAKLDSGKALKPVLENAQSAKDWQERQQHLAQAYEFVARMHNKLGITAPLTEQTSLFHERPFIVISTGVFSSAIANAISDPELKALTKKALIGGIDQISDSTDILEKTLWRPVIRALYTDGN